MSSLLRTSDSCPATAASSSKAAYLPLSCVSCGQRLELFACDNHKYGRRYEFGHSILKTSRLRSRHSVAFFKKHTMMVVAVFVIAITCCPLSSADSVSWIFSSPICSGSLIDWGTAACWSKMPEANDDVTITPPVSIPPFSVVVHTAVHIRSLAIEQYASIVLKQTLNVSESCQLCGTLNNTRADGSLSCKSVKSCSSFGASLFSGSANSSLTIKAVFIQNVTLVTETFGKIHLASSASCSRCSMSVARGGEFQASDSILSVSTDDCNISNMGQLVLGHAAADVHTSRLRYYDCNISSSSQIIFESSAHISGPVHISQFMKLQPSTALSLASTVMMQSLTISSSSTGQPATILFRPPAHASMSIDATIALGVLASFDSCPDAISFLNISTSGDIEWNCASIFFSSQNPSALRIYGQAHIRFGSIRGVTSNSIISADVSSSFIRNTNDQELKAIWSNVFNMENAADALIASNMLLDFASPVCYKPPSLSISLFESSSLILQGSHVLLFGVSLLIYNASKMIATSQTSYLQSLYVRSSMTVYTGNLYVSFAFGWC